MMTILILISIVSLGSLKWCIITPLLTVPRISKTLSKKIVKKSIESEEFKSVEDIKTRYFLESEHWLYIGGKFFAKNSIVNFTAYTTTTNKGNRINVFSFTFVDGSNYRMDCPWKKDYHKYMEEQVKKRLYCCTFKNYTFYPQDIKPIFKNNIKTAESKENIINSYEYINNLKSKRM